MGDLTHRNWPLNISFREILSVLKDEKYTLHNRSSLVLL